MNAKGVVVKVESLEEAGKRFVETYKKIMKKEKVRKQEILTFEN